MPYFKILITFFFIFSLYPSISLGIPRSMEELSSYSSKLTKTNVGYGSIGSFYRPTFGRMLDADLSMNNAEIVFIVHFPEGPRIYPQRIMVWHQVSNELFGKNSYAVTYCPITGSLAAFKTTLDGVALFFDVQGSLFGGNSVLIDRNTGSLWLQGIGMAFEGPLTGRGLATIPVFWTTWAAAKRVYQDVPVLSTPSGTYYDNDTLIFPVLRTDLRVPYKNEVIGLEFPNFRLAVDIPYIRKQGAVNFFLGEIPLLAVHDQKLDVVRIYHRQVWSDPSLFILSNGQLVDIGTKTVWDVTTGKALKGNMKDASMRQYFGVYSMWFNWYNLNPETYLIPGPGEVPKDVLHLNKMTP